MQLFESIFDLLYLILVLGLGIRLLFEKNKESSLFALMAILLGLGDSFHLIPRVMSHLSPGGFKAHEAALSWGQFVTSITMTIFYLLFFIYYKKKSGDDDKRKVWIVLFLVVARMTLLLLPQNQWGKMPGDALFGILRNIPFALLGALLIFWTYKHRNKDGLKHMSLLIFLSFAFYLPVVLWSQKIPALGALMMPKTVAYLLIVVLGYRHYIREFKAITLLAYSLSCLVMGLASGVFYREFTKYHHQGPTHLGKIHPHTLILGFVLLAMLYLFIRERKKEEYAPLQKPFFLYMSGLVLTMTAMMAYGIYDVLGQGQKIISIPALSGISGIGHLLLASGFIWTFLKIFSMEKKSLQAKEG